MLKKAVRQGYSQMHEATEYPVSAGRRDGEPTYRNSTIVTPSPPSARSPGRKATT